MTSILSIQSNSGISKPDQADDMCPATPTPSSPSKTYKISPNKSPNKASKHDKELKVLADMVENLTIKIKKRDKQVWQMQERADKSNEVTMRLEITNKSIADAATENQTLSRRVLNLEASIKTQYVEESDRWNSAAKELSSHTKRIDEVEFRQARPQSTIDLENVEGTTTSRMAADTQEHIHFLNQQAKVLEAASVIQAVTGLYSGRTTNLFESEADSESQDAASLSERMSTEKLTDEAELVIEDVTGSNSGHTTDLFASEANSAIQDVAILSERMSSEKLIAEVDLVVEEATGIYSGRTKKLFVSEALASLSERTSSEKLIDEEEFRQLEIQRTFAVLKVSEMSVALAESRAESDELRDQMASMTALLQQQDFGLSLVSESPMSVGLPRGRSLRYISNFWKSPKAPGRPRNSH
jgi:hypothetical protein